MPQKFKPIVGCLLVAACAALFTVIAVRADGSTGFRTAYASWYGPGLYGNKMACGGTLTRGTLGVAHKALRCGTKVRICVKRCTTVRVVDRGPYVAGREFDLTAATKYAVGFGDVGRIRVRVGG